MTIENKSIHTLDPQPKVWYNIRMKATDKHPTIEALLTSLTGRSRVECVDTGLCATCGQDALNTSFRDELSWKEYTISGMCQKCQDDFFGE